MLQVMLVFVTVMMMVVVVVVVVMMMMMMMTMMMMMMMMILLVMICHLLHVTCDVRFFTTKYVFKIDYSGVALGAAAPQYSVGSQVTRDI
jgi:hypothetical protein